MPAKKTATKKAATVKKPAGGKFTMSDVEYVNIENLRMYRKNPRVGDVDAIAESLDRNGQFKPIVVNRGTKNGVGDEILAGNHTWLGARKLGWDTIACVYVDVDEEDAVRIVLADNRTVDAGEYDDTILTSLLQDLPDLGGTGYDQVDLGSLLATLPSDKELSTGFYGEQEIHAVLPDNPDDLKTVEGALDMEDLDEDEEAPEPAKPGSVTVREKKTEATEADSIDAMPDELPGLIKVADDNVRFEMNQNEWDIPELIPDLIADIPDQMDCWAGPAICAEDDHPGKTWLYNYSSDSTKGMPTDRTYLGFFVFDERFENWWHRPSAMTSRALNAGYTHILQPDFSLIGDNPKAEQLYQVYRSFWLARFFQECGMHVVPKLFFGTSSDDLRWCTAGLPSRPKSLFIQLQTVIEGKDGSAEGAKQSMRLIKEALEIIQPEKLLCYTSSAGEKALEIIKPEMPVVIVPTRRRRWQQDKDDWLMKAMADERAKTKGKVKKKAS